ncbi:type VI secretion system-associated FHA domain protein TagH [Ketobacter sp.]
MELVLEITSSEKHLLGDNYQHAFLPAGGVIGRSAGCDWVIPDQTRHLSGRHVIISFEAGQFYVTDISTNGTHLNGAMALEKNKATVVSDGDRLVMGKIHFQARLHMQGAQSSPAISAHQIPRPGGNSAPGFSMNNPINDVQNPMSRVDEWAAQVAREQAQAAENQWHQRSQSMPDSVQPGREPFDPPKPVPKAAQPPVAASHDILPEDWWKREVPGPDASLLEPRPLEAAAPPVADSPSHLPPLRVPAPGGADSVETAAFAAGLGVSVGDIEQAGGAAFLQKAGMLLRTCLKGMVSATQSRASLKNEFRLDMTLVNTKDNNPIKLSANDEQVVRHMLSEEPGSFMPMEQAMGECFADVQEHQLAMMAGMQNAFIELMETLSPVALEKRFDRSKTGGLSLASRSARYWEAYRELHQDLLAEDDIFASLFAEPFARAYDEQVGKLKNARNSRGKQDD